MLLLEFLESRQQHATQEESKHVAVGHEAFEMTPLDFLAELASDFGVEGDFLDANLVAEYFVTADEAGIVVRSRVFDLEAGDRVGRRFLDRSLFLRELLVVEVEVHLSDDEDLVFVLDALEIVDLVDGFYFLGLEEALQVVPVRICSVVSLRLKREIR